MSFFSSVIAVTIAGSAAIAGAQSQSSDPIVQVGLYRYDAAGSVSGMAYDTGPTLSSVVYLSGPSSCVMGAGNRQPPADATDMWRVSGKVLSSSPEQAVVQLDWQRVLAQGQKVDTPSGSSQLTIGAGERVLLDSVTPSVLSSCSPASVGFEARYAPRPFPMTGKKGGGSGASAGSGTVGGGGGSAVAGVGAGRLSSGVGGGAAARTDPAGTGQYDVNLWLVHSAPGRDDEVLHQTLRATLRAAPHRADLRVLRHPGDLAFAFAPVTIDTAGGGVIVQVTGSVTVVEDASGQKLIFETARRVTLPQADQPRDTAAAAGAQGGSISARPMPGPDEVLSFEMPPILLNGRPMVPDKFSVRVRITPR